LGINVFTLISSCHFSIWEFMLPLPFTFISSCQLTIWELMLPINYLGINVFCATRSLSYLLFQTEANRRHIRNNRFLILSFMWADSPRTHHDRMNGGGRRI
jgi:hypothetical protein